MTFDKESIPISDPTERLDVDFNTVLYVLASSARRFVITCLDEHPNPMTLRDEPIRLGAWKQEVPVADVPREEIKPVYTGLHHVHIPNMEDAGIVEHDSERDTVACAASNDELLVFSTLLGGDEDE